MERKITYMMQVEFPYLDKENRGDYQERIHQMEVNRDDIAQAIFDFCKIKDDVKIVYWFEN